LRSEKRKACGEKSRRLFFLLMHLPQNS
jgi:hypothetical protein